MNQDLKSRIPVAILYVVAITLMTLCGPTSSSILLAIFMALSLTEFLKAEDRMSNVDNSIIAVVLIGCVAVMFGSFGGSISPVLIYVSCLFFIISIIHLVLHKAVIFQKIPTLIAAILYIILPFYIAIHQSLEIDYFPKVLLGTFILLWLNDAGAYFTGRAFGKRKLFVSVSPGKTWEGLIGGGIIGTLTSLLLPSVLQVLDLKSWLALSLVIWVTGAYGDLIESSWKRAKGIKDSGTIMKGHGGFLDRLDSFIYAVPFVSLYIILIY